VCAAQLPGRAKRISEPAFSRLADLVEAIGAAMTPLVDKPILQYGIEEALGSGMDKLIVVLSKGKEMREATLPRSTYAGEDDGAASQLERS